MSQLEDLIDMKCYGQLIHELGTLVVYETGTKMEKDKSK